MVKVAIEDSGDQNSRWQWAVNGWHTLLDKASHAITYFTPNRSDEPDAAQRWGVLATDVVDQQDSVIVELELPGMDKADLSVEVVEDHLIISGHKRSSGTRREGAILITERAFGNFKRVLALPCAVDGSAIQATYEKGILSVNLPKSAAQLARKIPVIRG
jgi:HSP20 family protein